MTKVYAAVKPCGHIVAAFPLALDPKAKAEVAKQFIANGWDLTQVEHGEVQFMFDPFCGCGEKPPLLQSIEVYDLMGEGRKIMAELQTVPTISILQRRLRIGYTTAQRLQDELRQEWEIASDRLERAEKLHADPVTGEVIEQAEPLPPAEAPTESVTEVETDITHEAQPVDHQAEADELLNNFLEKKDDGQEEGDEQPPAAE